MTDNQSTTIAQLSKRPIGKEYRTGGFQLTLKRARNTKQVGKKWLQEVLFLDSTGEIPGEILLDKFVPLQTNAKINIIICWLQDGEDGPKLYVEQWKPETWTADEHFNSRKMDYSSFDPENEFIIRSKIRHGVVCAMIQAKYWGNDRPTFEPDTKLQISKIVEFIMTGE